MTVAGTIKVPRPAACSTHTFLRLFFWEVGNIRISNWARRTAGCACAGTYSMYIRCGQYVHVEWAHDTTHTYLHFGHQYVYSGLDQILWWHPFLWLVVLCAKTVFCNFSSTLFFHSFQEQDMQRTLSSLHVIVYVDNHHRGSGRRLALAKKGLGRKSSLHLTRDTMQPQTCSEKVKKGVDMVSLRCPSLEYHWFRCCLG